MSKPVMSSVRSAVAATAIFFMLFQVIKFKSTAKNTISTTMVRKMGRDS
jgi:hypothetical protein